MNFPICNHTAIFLAARTEMTEQQAAKLWCVKSGAIRIDTLAPEATTAKPSFLRLALKGDLLGVERLAAVPDQLRLTAITPSCLSPVNLAEEQQWQQCVLQALLSAHQRHREAIALRCGTVEERVRRLLQLLADAEQDQAGTDLACTLPSLGNMADILLSTRETICRALTHLRDTHLLEDQNPSHMKRRRLENRSHLIRNIQALQ
ncbi:Crp/Fnr family transcriptional regulator [Undibacterium sp. CY7W]|uniref:Crp/Fnr family transcriptional regulator n=1 Tax=Undibacterium rugosum TaxID=2762291 RepID=A0A923I0B8_9BURK|nr:Crp/Fnr family transcriptional regulator [Undibacterium rugosum]MBC3935311.1 Crp/Fnr family transcriptional regulator [Undibacterium rugosum]